MRVGIDVDGVLIDTREFMLSFGRRFFRREPVDPDGYTIEEMFGVSGVPVLLFGMRWFLPYYCRKYPPYKEAAGVYRRLKKRGSTIFQITARKFALSRSPLGRYSFNSLKKWLKRNRFCYDRLLLVNEKEAAREKLKCCRRFGIDVMIEDNPETALTLARNGIWVLLFDAPYNRNASADRIIRVKNWREAEEYLGKLGSKIELRRYDHE